MAVYGNIFIGIQRLAKGKTEAQYELFFSSQVTNGWTGLLVTYTLENYWCKPSTTTLVWYLVNVSRLKSL